MAIEIEKYCNNQKAEDNGAVSELGEAHFLLRYLWGFFFFCWKEMIWKCEWEVGGNGNWTSPPPPFSIPSQPIHFLDGAFQLPANFELNGQEEAINGGSLLG